MYQSGVELPLFSRYLEHAQLETTKIYAQPSIEMMRNAIITGSQAISTDKKPLWDSEDEMAKDCGLR
jgi:hypothetical protein